MRKDMDNGVGIWACYHLLTYDPEVAIFLLRSFSITLCRQALYQTRRLRAYVPTCLRAYVLLRYGAIELHSLLPLAGLLFPYRQGLGHVLTQY